MVSIGLIGCEQHHFRVWICKIRVVTRHLILSNNGSPVRLAGVIHKEPSTRRILRLKSQTQQASVSNTQNSALAVEKERGGFGAGLRHKNSARLFDNESSPGPVLSTCKIDGVRKTR